MGESTPICRCRVLYLGSAVPRQSKDGLQGIQEPLRSLYPSEGALGAKGIDSWLSVWSNGILLENVDENRKQVTRFFPIESLHYCAAVRQVLIPERGQPQPEPKFLPLDSPFARTPKAQHPPIFAAILRRTTGIKVLECHVFICKREAAANALVRCCFHAYADNSYARQLEGGGGNGGGGGGGGSGGSVYGTLGKPNMMQPTRSGGGGGMMGGMGGSMPHGMSTAGMGHHHGGGGGGGGGSHHHVLDHTNGWRSRAGSTTTLNSVDRHPVDGMDEAYTVKNLYASSADLDVVDDGEGSLYNGNENHKIWSGSQDRLDALGSESPYDIYSGSGVVGIGGASTLGRTPRARQISAPVPVPPPPKLDDPKKHKHNNRDKKSKQSSSQSLSGTLIRPKPVHANTLQRLPPPGTMMYAPMHRGQPRQFHTFSHRGGGGGHHPGLGMIGNGGGSTNGIYGIGNGGGGGSMNGMAPPPPPMMSMPMHMQMPVMIHPQYATLQSAKGNKKKKKDKGMNGMPVGMPVAPAMFAYPPPSSVGGPEPRPLAMSNRKLAQSAAAGLDEAAHNSGAESPGGTGIYRRKGHLNERAFSYSIRQEHRSRSHGSLASLQFNPPDMKKEREIAQMVAGLDLNDQETQMVAHNMRNGPGSSGTFGKPRR